MRRRWVAVARGDEEPELVLKGGQVLSVFTGELFQADVAIVDGYVVGVGTYDGDNALDVSGRFLIPGYIDGHCHVESSKLTVDEFARAILPTGTTSVVVDPHELANVLGTLGVEYLLESSKGLPLGVYVMIPSSTPASQFDAEVAAFVRAVEGGQPPTPSVIDAYRIHALIDQLYAAGTTRAGGDVRLRSAGVAPGIMGTLDFVTVGEPSRACGGHVRSTPALATRSGTW